ncbi:MAG: RluA family pseudouridine synthase [Myxococcota bacterium]
MSGLFFVYEAPSFVVIDKPVGLLSIPGNISQDSVATRMQAYTPGYEGPHVVHRLDMDTSGLMVVARTKEAHRALSIEFEDRVVEKAYVALLEGILAEDSGHLAMPFRRNWQDRPRQIYDPVRGKVGETDWRVLSREGGRTRVELRPKTGRTHQLRAQAAHPLGLGAPIVGDRLYGTPAERLLLHASWLRFAHPETGEWLEFESQPPF